LEVLAGKIVAERASSEGLKGLEDMLAGMEEAITEGDVERWSELNTEFHNS